MQTDGNLVVYGASGARLGLGYRYPVRVHGGAG